MNDFETKMHTEYVEKMTTKHYDELISLMHEKILRLEREKDAQRKEINRLNRELKQLRKN